MIVLLLLAPTLGSGGQLSSLNVQNCFSYFADIAPLAVAVGVVMVAGEFDIAAIGYYVVGGVIAVKLGETSPVLGLLAAGAFGIVAAGLVGLIVAWTGINAVPLTLGVFIMLWGVSNLLAEGEEVILFDDALVSETLTKPVLDIFPVASLVVLGMIVALGVVLRFTRLGPTVRALGGDRRACEVAGVRVGRALVAVFATAGFIAAVGGALHSYALLSATSAVNFAPLIVAVTAAVIGGVAISGGEGSPLGIGLGVLTLAVLSEAMVVMAAEPSITSIVTGSFLLVIAIVGAPLIGRVRDMVRTRRARPAVTTDIG
jgi:ribose transport system permease protein